MSTETEALNQRVAKLEKTVAELSAKLAAKSVGAAVDVALLRAYLERLVDWCESYAPETQAGTGTKE